MAAFPKFLDEFEQLLQSNEILMERTQGVGVLSKELAINAAVSGPMAERPCFRAERIEAVSEALTWMPSRRSLSTAAASKMALSLRSTSAYFDAFRSAIARMSGGNAFHASPLAVNQLPDH